MREREYRETEYRETEYRETEYRERQSIERQGIVRQSMINDWICLMIGQSNQMWKIDCNISYSEISVTSHPHYHSPQF